MLTAEEKVGASMSLRALGQAPVCSGFLDPQDRAPAGAAGCPEPLGDPARMAL